MQRFFLKLMWLLTKKQPVSGLRVLGASITLLVLGVLWLVVVPICLLLTILTPNKTLKPIQD
jgi:hypothetical protein